MERIFSEKQKEVNRYFRIFAKKALQHGVNRGKLLPVST
jgi:hypothetical protein